MERLDIYTPEHVRTGRHVERGEPVFGEDRLLVVHACVFNDRAEMLIQRRQAWKDRYPDRWDLSAGGFVRSGEESARAAQRELREELGLDLPQEMLCFLFTEPFSFVLDDFYLARWSGQVEDLSLQAEEISEVKWASWHDTERLLCDGSFVDYPSERIAQLYQIAGERSGERTPDSTAGG